MANDLLKVDDLYWNDKEEKYVALSDDELEKIISAFMLDRKGGIKSVSSQEVYEIVSWASSARVDHLLLQGVLAGRIQLEMSEEGETLFYEAKENYDFE